MAVDEGEENGAPSDAPEPTENISLISNGAPVAPGVTDEAQRLTPKARQWTNTVLRFLSSASNETLGACIVGLGAVTYLILGRVGLILIGLVAGVALHAIWEESEHDHDSEKTNTEDRRRRREKSLDIIQRLLDLRVKAPPDDTASEENAIQRPNDDVSKLATFAPDTRYAMEGFIESVMRDYVHWWYGPILPDETSFPKECRRVLTNFFLSISNRLSRKRPGDMFLDFLTNSSSIVIVFLNELSAALSASRGLSPKEAVNGYLDDNPGCSLGNVLNREQQQRKLKAIAEDVLQTFLEAKSYACEPVRAFLREVLANLILDATVASCSRADFINEWIIWALEESDASDLVEAIDQGVNVAANNEAVKKAANSTAGVAQADQDTDIETERSAAQSKADHRRTVSKAEEAMEEAMREAQRLNEMIAEEEKARSQKPEGASVNGDVQQPQSPVLDGIEPQLNGRQNEVHEDIAKNGEIDPAEHSDPVESNDRPISDPVAGFRSFDQILADQKPTALREDVSPPVSPPLPSPQFTLHKAQVSIFDDSTPGEKGTIRSKPIAEYLLQVEPASSTFPGWMVAKKYTDFETLHEVLRRISVISGVTAFADRHLALPGWKGNTKNGLRTELEKYLQDALSFQRLAECEGMKRFLDKDQHMARMSPATKNNFPAAFETMGKGVLDVLSSAPKGAATGGKAIVGGVTGVFGTVGSLGQRKQSSKNQRKNTNQASTSNTSLPSAKGDPPRPNERAHASQDSVQIQSSPITEATQVSQDGSRGSNDAMQPAPRESQDASNLLDQSSPSLDGPPLHGSNGLQGPRDTPIPSPEPEEVALHLPPPPSEISDDYHISPRPSIDGSTILQNTMSANPTKQSNSLDAPLPSTEQSSTIPNKQPATSNTASATATPLTIQETTVAVELFFATINELYTLSSAWTLRLTLLNTAKSFLLRPGNANLEAIRQLLQTTIIDANTSDSGIASHINKTRENALPTEEELKQWPPALTPEESERRREKARRLLVEKGMPQALTSVMGQAASGEALGKVFDCLQVSEVARGLVFALLLQAVRALTQ